jgi:hypothetical protein
MKIVESNQSPDMHINPFNHLGAGEEAVLDAVHQPVHRELGVGRVRRLGVPAVVLRAVGLSHLLGWGCIDQPES